ncbi:MAG: response regulator [Nannocystaceae bacterium]
MKFLLIDDSKALRSVTKRRLAEAGWTDVEFVEAQSGEEGLSMISEHSPDLVLCDWNMPGMNGLEVLKRLNAAKVAVKFGFVTSENLPEVKEMAKTEGALFMIIKPFSSATLKDVLAPVIAGEVTGIA